MTVFIGWSALPASTAIQRTPRSSTHSANARVGPGWRMKYLRLVELRAVGPVLRVVAVIAGVDDQDVAALDAQAGVLLPALEVLRSVQVVVADAHALEVDDAGRTDQEVERQVADELAAGHEVRRRVEVRADVQGHRDLLPAGPARRRGA